MAWPSINDARTKGLARADAVWQFEMAGRAIGCGDAAAGISADGGQTGHRRLAGAGPTQGVSRVRVSLNGSALRGRVNAFRLQSVLRSALPNRREVELGLQ